MLSMHLLLHFNRSDQADERFILPSGWVDYQLHKEGRTVKTASLEWSESLIDDLALLRRPEEDPTAIQRVGNRLREFLGEAGWELQEAQILAALEEGRSVIITFSANAAELYALPWELVTIEATGQRLGEMPGVLIRYAWPGLRGARQQREARPEGGRILLATADSGGLVPTEQHCAAIAEACHLGHYDAFFNSEPGDGEGTGGTAARSLDGRREHREADVLDNLSLANLAETLQRAEKYRQPIAILHILCHGASRGRGDKQIFGLTWHDGPRGKGEAFVSPDRLRALLSQPYARQLRLVVLAACDSGNIGSLGNHVGAVAQAVHQAGVPAVIASRYPLSVPGSNAMARALYETLLVGPGSLERAFLCARERLSQLTGADATTALDWASLQLYALPEHGDDTRPVVFRPYRGLAAFHTEHTRFFFGRQGKRAETVNDLRALARAGKPRFLVVMGASGTGKSSMVLAGVIPDLLDEQRRAGEPPWQWTVMRPGGDPDGALDEALSTRNDPGRPFLLVVDQFEELFTHTGDATARKDFVQRLWSLASGPTDLYCIVTLRIDFLGACGDLLVGDEGRSLEQIIADDDDHHVLVAHLTPSSMRAAIEEPARLVGLRLQEGLTERILTDVAGEPGSLPLLQYTLRLLWKGRSGRMLTSGCYDELGGVIGALQQQADRSIEALRREFGDAGVAHARRMLVKLVVLGDDGTNDTRRRVPLDQLVGHEQPEQSQVLARLIEARLVVRDEQAGETVLTVAHEALIRSWKQLRDWLGQDRHKSIALAELDAFADQHRKHETLLRDVQLGYACELRDRYREDVSDDVLALIAASETADRARRRRRTLITVAIALLALAMTIAAVLAYRAKQSARESEARTKRAEVEARGSARQARDASRMTVVQGMDRRDSSVALMVLREVEADDPRNDVSGWWDEVRESESEWLTVQAFPSLLDDNQSVQSAAFSAQGVRVVTSDEGQAQVRTLVEGTWSEPTMLSTGAFRARMSSNGSRILVFTVEDEAGPMVHAWTLTDGRWRESQRQFQLFDGVQFPIPVSADCTRFILNGDGDWRIVSLTTDGAWRDDSFKSTERIGFSRDMDHVLVVPSTKDRIVRKEWNGERWLSSELPEGSFTEDMFQAAVSPDGTQILPVIDKEAKSEPESRMWIFKNGAWRPVSLRPERQGVVVAALFSDDGGRLATIWQRKLGGITFYDWSVWTKNDEGTWVEDELEVVSEAVLPMAFSPAGDQLIAKAMARGEAYTWKLGRSGEWTIHLFRGDVGSAQFNADGSELLTVAAVVRLWRPSGGPFTHQPLAASHVGGPVVSSDNGAHLVVSQEDPAIVRTWIRGTWQASSLPDLDREESLVAFNAAGTRLVVFTSNDRATLWSLVDERWHPEPVTAPPKPVEAASVSADGARLLIVSASEHQLYVWTRSTGKWTRNRLESLSTKVLSAVLSADGEHIVAISKDAREAHYWTLDATGNVADGSPRTFDLSGGPAREGRHSAWLSLDGTRVALVSDRVVDLYVQSGAQGKWSHDTPELDMDFIQSAAFSPDGTQLVTAAIKPQCTWRLVEDKSWRSQCLGNQGFAIYSARFSPSGTRLVARSRKNREASVWFLTKAELIPRMWRAIPQCLSVEERRSLLGETLEVARANQARCWECVAWYQDRSHTSLCPAAAPSVQP